MDEFYSISAKYTIVSIMSAESFSEREELQSKIGYPIMILKFGRSKLIMLKSSNGTSLLSIYQDAGEGLVLVINLYDNLKEKMQRAVL